MLARSSRVLVGLVALLVVFALSGGSAAALLTHPFLGEFGATPETGFGNVQGLAVDESSGDVYVYDAANGGTLLKFDPSGKPAKFSGLPGEPSEIESVGSGAPTEDQVAVDNSSLSTKGDIYVAANDGVVKIFGPDGKALGAIEAESSAETVAKEANKEPVAPWGEALGVTVDSSGNVYVGLYAAAINKYAPKGKPVTAKDYVSSVFTRQGVANVVVDSVGDVYASTWTGGAVVRYESSQFGRPFGQGNDVDTEGMAVAVDPKTDDVLVDQGNRVEQFGPRGEPLLSPSLVFANVSGSDGIAVSGVNGVTYVSTGRGQVARYGPLVLLPDTTTGAATEVTANGAVLHGTVNPDGVPITNCRFEYGRGTDYGQSVPCSPSPGEGSAPVEVSASVSLESWVDYHFRLVAGNANGDNPGTDQRAFTEAATAPAASDTCPNASVRLDGPSELLPDCRAYEMVSPLDKNGSSIGADLQFTSQAAFDGQSVSFIAFSGFADTTGSERAGFTSYVATRGAAGWSSHSITPAAPLNNVQASSNGVKMADLVFTEDLSHAVYLGGYFLGADPGTGSWNLYREDTASRALETVTLDKLHCECLEKNELEGLERGPVGYSSDAGVITFQTKLALLPGATGANELYEWDHGVLRLAGILPGETAPAPGGSMAPGGSAGGSSLWAIENHNAVSSDGSRVLFVSPAGGSAQPQLYMRKNGTSTVWLSRSWTSTPVAEPAGIQFVAASADDTKVLFTSTTPLLNSDTGEGSTGIYLYTDTSENAESEGKLTFIARVNGRSAVESREHIVAGMSEDGTHIYFFNGDVVSVESKSTLPRAGEYLWDSGALHFVAGVTEPIDPLGKANRQIGVEESAAVRISSDGRRMAFPWRPRPESEPELAKPGAQDNSEGTTALYAYDERSEKLTCTSCPPNGSPATSNAVVASVNGKLSIAGNGGSAFYSRFMTNDGRYVFFDTEQSLLFQDTNGLPDVYEYNIDKGELRLISSGAGENGSWFEDASANGSDVFFLTAQKLTGWDTDTLIDLYDARVDSELPESSPPPVPCDGDACQGVPSAVPSFNTASGFTGLGNQHPNVAAVKKKAKRTSKPKKHPKRRAGKKGHAGHPGKTGRPRLRKSVRAGR
jgi:hypothetical protein